MTESASTRSKASLVKRFSGPRAIVPCTSGMQLAASGVMKKEYASNIRVSQLSLVDEPASSTDAPADIGTPATTGTEGDNDAGKAGADRPVAARPAFHARAMAAAAAKRGEESSRSTPPMQGSREADIADSGARSERAGKERRRSHHVGAWLNPRRLILIGGALGSLVLLAGLITIFSSRAPAPQPNLSQAAPTTSRPTPLTPASAAAGVAAPLREVPSEDYVAKVQALKSADNWNLLVIYAAEWTRKQPSNPEAWQELSAGYLKLHQLRDALDAANKAVQVAPDGFLGWQNLGLVNLTLERPSDALGAFQKAVALNDKDVTSLVQIGTLNAQLGRLPEARIAFANALVSSPENVDALCGGLAVAQREGRAQDAQAMSGQLNALYASCPDPSPAPSVRVVADSSAKAKGQAPARR